MAAEEVRYRLTRKAFSDIDEIFDYTAENWSLDQAEAYQNDLFQTFEDIARGRAVSRPYKKGSGTRRTTVRSHVVFFERTEPGFVDILRILHARMDHQSHV